MSGVLGCGVAMMNSTKYGNHVCNFSGLIPKNFNQGNWCQTRDNSLSILSPSAVNAWLQINKRYGSLSFDRLCEPAIEYADNGFNLTEANNFFISLAKKNEPSKIFDEYYNKELKTGDLFFQKKTAAALRLIAKYQENALVNSPLSKAIDLALTRAGSSLKLEDIKREQISWQVPLSTEVFSHQVSVPPPNSNGFMVLQAAKIIEKINPYDIEHNGSLYIDMVVKTIKGVFDHAKKLKPNQSIDLGHTTTVLTHDSSGNTAIMTQTLGGLYGSGIWVDKFGIPFNGLGAYCLDDLPELPSKGGGVTPSRAPQPISLVQVFKKGELKYVFGTPGGFTIVQTELQVLLNLLVFKMPLDKAIDAPRFFVDKEGGLSVEDRISSKVISELTRLGYTPKVLDSYSWILGCMQGFEKSETSTFVGDSRRHAQSIAI